MTAVWPFTPTDLVNQPVQEIEEQLLRALIRFEQYKRGQVRVIELLPPNIAASTSQGTGFGVPFKDTQSEFEICGVQLLVTVAVDPLDSWGIGWSDGDTPLIEPLLAVGDTTTTSTSGVLDATAYHFLYPSDTLTATKNNQLDPVKLPIVLYNKPNGSQIALFLRFTSTATVGTRTYKWRILYVQRQKLLQ